MRKLVALGILLITGIELLALIVHERRLVLAGAGVALALVLLNIRRFLGHEVHPEAEPGPEDLAVMGANLMDPRRRRAVLETSLRTSAAMLAGARQDRPQVA